VAVAIDNSYVTSQKVDGIDLYQWKFSSSWKQIKISLPDHLNVHNIPAFLRNKSFPFDCNIDWCRSIIFSHFYTEIITNKNKIVELYIQNKFSWFVVSFTPVVTHNNDDFFVSSSEFYMSGAIDHLRNRLNFDLNKSRQKFHHSLKEPHKISIIAKFRCEML
jgi:hypothetical protein